MKLLSLLQLTLYMKLRSKRRIIRRRLCCNGLFQKNMEIKIRRVLQEDRSEWFRMRKGIWPEAPDEYLNFDMDDILVNDNYFVIFACDGDKPIGLTEVQIRDYGEGC